MTRLPAPGDHGGDAAAVAAALGMDPKDVLDLSQSLNPVAPDPLPVLRRHVDAAIRYPDPTQATAVLAEAMGIDQGRLLLTNGGAEAIRLVSEEMGGRVVEPEFALHPRRGGPLWRSNPHNPSGLLAGEDEHAGVWDEAFYAIATGSWTRGDAASVVVGSLTKLLGCPGLRLGYVLAPAGEKVLIAACHRRQSLWAVNGLAVSALPDLLARVDLRGWSARVRLLRAQLVALLHGHGLDPRPSDANWVLVEGRGLRARLAPYGIVVRDCTSFGLPEMVRIAVPGPKGLERLDEALTSVMRSANSVTETAGAMPAPASGAMEDLRKKGAS